LVEYVKLTNPVVASCAVLTVLSSAYPDVGTQIGNVGLSGLFLHKYAVNKD
jgi:hypothetical protein